MGNNRLEMEVTLGLQTAQSQIKQLHSALEDSVKMDASSFNGINKILNQATTAAEKLAGKLDNAFKTSNSSKNFLKEYERMLEMITTAKSKMGNLGFEDIKFSTVDQRNIDDAVNRVKELSQILNNIDQGKAIEIINNSSITGIENLRNQIKQLQLDTEGLTFENLKTNLEQATETTKSHIQEITNDINNINQVVKNLDLTGLERINNALQSHGEGLKTILIDNNSVDQANAKLHSYAQTLEGIKTPTLVINRNEDIAQFVANQTTKLEKEYNKQLDIIKSNRDKINTELTKMRMPARENGRFRALNDDDKQQLLNSTEMQAAIQLLNINLDEEFNKLGISEKFNRIKEEFQQGIKNFNEQEVNLTTIRDNLQNNLTHIFDDMGEKTVKNASELFNSISKELNTVGINIKDLKSFGFDLKSISAGESLVAVYEKLRTSLEAFSAAQTKLAGDMSTNELVAAEQALHNLAEASQTAQEAESKQGDTIESLKQQLKDQQVIIDNLVKAYQQLIGQKINIPTGDFGKAESSIQSYINSLTRLENKEKTLGNIQMAANRWMGFYQVLNLTKRAINDMKQHIQELDTVMTSIAVVTNMSQDDLWGQISKYSEIARQYGVAIKGVYEVSQIYYQQGLQSNDVMTLTTETLKMARIAGLDYATAADYMTTAIRGFKLEMQDASHVTDVFSALAATTASSTEELAVAISKTAASAEAVGSSFEATTAMMATMIATTRESATNIGTALKSVISRYGEMTADPTALRDSEGEEMSLNRVDAALQTVGITIHDTAGQFRDFDDVLLELMEKWDSLDSLSQRYIATLMAGNRQQSRFLALVSNVDEYKKALQTANDAAGTGDLQTLKTLDSIDARIEKMKVTIQEFYTSSGIQDLYKNILDTITNIVSAGNSLPKILNKFPASALIVATSLITIMKNAMNVIIKEIQLSLQLLKSHATNTFEGFITPAGEAGAKAGEAFKVQFEQRTKSMGSQLQSILGHVLSIAGSGISLWGGYNTLSGLAQYGKSTSREEDMTAGQTTRTGGLLSILGSTISGAGTGFAMGGGPFGALAGAGVGLFTGIIQNITTLSSAANMLNVTLARQIELDEKAISAAQERLTRSKGESSGLENAYKQLKQLKDAQYDSAEAAQEYANYMNQLGDSYPYLITSMNEQGNVLIELTNLEKALAEARADTIDKTIDVLEEEKKGNINKQQGYKDFQNQLIQTDVTASTVKTFLEQSQGFLYDNDKTDVANVVTWYLEKYLTKDSPLYEQAYKQSHYYVQDGDQVRAYINSDSAKNYIAQHPEVYEALFTTAMDAGDDYGAQVKNLFASHFKTLLSDISAQLNIPLDKLTNIKDFSLDSIDALDNDKLIKLIENVREHLQDDIDELADQYKQIDKTLSYSKTSKDVDTYLQSLHNSEKEIDQQTYNNVKDYDKLMTFILDAVNPNAYIDFNDVTNAKNYREPLVKWLSNNKSTASKLTQVNYSQYRNISDFYKDFDNLQGTAADHGWQEQFLQERNDAVAGITEQLNQIFGQSSTLFRNLIDITEDTISTDDFELNTEIIGYLRSDLSKYSSLIQDKQYAAASAYLNSLTEVYDYIGGLTSQQQAKIAPIISSLDFTSSDSLTKAAEQLQTMGGFDDLVNTLNTAATRLMYNVGVMTQRLQSSLQETIENVEKAAESAGKGVKYSEAYKNAAEILTKYDGTEELAFDDIYQYNEAVGGYLLTRRGLELQLSQQSADAAKQIEEAKEQAKMMDALFDSGIVSKMEIARWDTQVGKNFNIRRIQTAMAQFGHEITEQQAEAFATQIESLQKEYAELGEDKPVWEEWIKTKQEEIAKALKIDEQMAEALMKNSIGMSIVSLDYTKIAGGTGGYLKDTLAAYLSQLGLNIDDYWNDLLEGKVDSLNQALKDAGVDAQISKETSKAALQAQVQSYLTAIEELQSGKSFESWSDVTKSALADISRQGRSVIGRENSINSLYDALHELIDTSDYTLDQYNNDVAALTTKIQGLGKEKATTDLLTGGFKLEEFATYLNNYVAEGLDDISKYFTDGVFTAEGYEGLFEADVNGEYQIAAGHTIEEVVKFFNEVLGMQINKQGENWKNYLGSETDRKIADLDKADTGKQAASIVSKIASGKVGDRISLEGLPDKLKAILDKNGNKIFEITNEAVRDNILLALDPNAFDEEYQQIIKELQDNIKSKRNLGQATTGMISKQVKVEDMQAYTLALTGNDLSPEAARSYLINTLKYTYDSVNDVYNATKESIPHLQKLAETAKKRGASSEYISGLEATIAGLEWELGDGKYYDAVTNIVSNYQEVSDEAKRAFELAFEGVERVDSSKIFTQIKGTENYKVNIAELLAQIGNYMNDAAKDMIFQIATGYMDNISTAASLRTQGTNSLTEMQDFAKSYTEITGEEKQYGDLFSFDSELHAYILNQEAFASMISKAKEKVIADLEAAGYTDKGQIKQIANETILAPIREFNFSSIADNSATNADKAILRGYLEAAGATDVDTIMSQLSQGIFTSLEAQLSDLNIPDAIKRTTRASQATSMQTAINDLIDGIITPEDIATLDEYGITLAEGVKSGQDEALAAARSLAKELVAFVEEGAIQLTEVQKSMQQILSEQWVNAGFGRGKAAIDILSGGLSISELGSFMDTWGGELNDVFDETTQQLKGPLADVFKIDEFTGDLIYKSGKSAEEILKAYEEQMGISLDRSSAQYRNAISTITDEQIAKLDSEDFDKQEASQLNALASAKVGQRVNVSQISETVRKKLSKAGLSITGDWLEVTSEQTLNEALLALDSMSAAYKKANPETAAEIQSIIDDLASKMNLGSALTNIIGATVDKGAGESLQLAIEHTTKNNDAFMRGMGFVWNDLTQQWTATADSIKAVQAQIDGLRAQGKDTETINNLQATLNNLDNSMRDQRTNAIQDVVSNYSNISEESIAAFETAFIGFGINIRDYIDTDALGNQKVDLAALNQALAQVGYDINQLFQEEIAAIGDSYLQAISSGISILSSGTNNLADISKIAKDLDPNLTAQDIGYYDEILKAWTIDGNVVRQYVEKQADKLKAMGIMPEDQVDKWVEQNTKGIASENIDIMGFLSGDRSQDDVNKIGRALETYYEVIGWPVKTAREHVETALNTLIKGGEEAVAMAKGIKPTLTESELAEIYSSAFNRWNDMFNEIENIVVGDVVTGDLRKVLSQLNMVDGNGVVTSAFNMVDAYTAIYNQMKQTAGSTTTSLNAAYAKLLTAKDQSRIDAIDALGDAMGMSYDALGELLARYGRSLEDELNNLYYERLGNGKVRITDFTQFASDLGLDTNSEEYLSAFKQYNESLIELDRKTAKNIKDELSNLISAKAGTRLDISQLSNALGEDTINGLIHQYGGFVQDGILSLATSTDIPGMFAAIRDQIQSGENRTIQLTETELAELQDAIDGLLSNIISLISTGVSGSLNNAQAAELKSWASANGIQNLDFQPTVDGLKLTEESFFNLYATLSKINKLESKKLLPDMQKMSRSYGDLLSATREYNRTLTEAANDNNANKRQGLQDLIKSYLQDPNTYKTMGQQLPTEWQIAQNFYEDAYSGMQVLKAASAKKTMGVEDFYSMINTAGSLNPNFAINGMGMDELLDAAANSLQIVDGKLSVNLEKAGITAKNGMKQFSEGWLAGLENLRRTESGYLEAYTRLSKVHDAMGKLQPIDFNLFDSDSGEFTQNAIDYLNNLGTQLGQDVTKGILFNGISLQELLMGNPADWAKAGFKDNASISAFIKNLSQIDFNADDIVSQLEQLTSDNPMTIRMNNEHGFIAIEPTGNVIDINWDDKTVQKNIQQFVGKRLQPKTIKDKIEEAYANKDSVDFNAQVHARAILALASGQIDTSGFTRDNKGHWSGYYNGQLYTGDDYATLVERITKSMLASESGFQVTLDDGNPVTGTKYVNGVEITLDIEKGTYYAKYGNETKGPFDTKEALNKWIAENVGGGDTESHFEIDGTDYGVYIDEQTGLSYTKWVDDNGDPHWKYHGHEFTEYSAFLAYAKSLREYSQYGEVSDSEDGNTTTITINENASIEMEVTPDSVTTTYWFKGEKLTKEAFDQYLAAQNEGTFTLDTDGSMHYEHSGMTVEVEITNGEVVFRMTVDGITFEGDKASIETAINQYAQGQVDSLNPSSGSSFKGITLTYNGFKIKVNANGETEYYTPNGEKTTRAALQTLLGDKAQAELGKIDRAAQVSASSIKLAESSGAEVKIDESLKATIKAAIAEIPAEIKVTAETDGAVKAINALQDAIEKLQDKTVNVTVIEKVSKAKGSNIPTKTPPHKPPKIEETKLVEASGNVALAGGRSTLMGELGPELYVTNGHYYVAGKNGAEFVDLPDDAIVFNHLQTRKLLDKGASGRGHAVTNEQRAVAQAKGNMNGGPAMANTMSGLTFIVTRYKSGSGTKTNATLDKDAKSAVSSLIQDVINKGFEYINLEDYKNLPAEVKALAQKAIANGSYRDFIAEVAEYSDKTVKEFNDLYMQSWQKDLGAKSGEMHGALSGITEYQNGMIGIAAGDLSTVLDKTKITELTNAGILAYSGLIDTYFVKSWDDLIEHVPNLVDNENIESYRKDGDSAARKKLEELYEKAYSEGLTNIERDQMKLYAGLMNVDLSYLNWFEDSEGKLRLQFDSSTLSGIKSEGAKDAKAEAQDAIDKAIISLINGEVVGYTEFLEASTNAKQAFGKDFDLKRLTGVVDDGKGYSSDDILSLFKTYELMQEQGRDVSQIYQAFKDKFSQTDLSLDDFQSYSAALKDAFEQGSIKEDVFIELNRTLNDAFIEKTNKLATDIVNATSEEGISDTAATELIEELQGFGVDFSKAFVTNAQGKQVLDWSQIIIQLQKLYEQYPEFGAQLTKKVMDSLPEEVLKDLDLTPLKEITEQMGKEAAKGYNKLLNTQADQMRESVKNVSSTIVDAFNGHISSADYSQFVDDITSLKLNPADYGFTETKQGWKVSFEGVLKLFNDLIKDFPEDAKQILNSVDFKELTAEQAAEYKKAIEDAVARGEITPTEAAKWVAPIDDALREKASGISDLIVKAIKGTATATEVNDIRAQIQKDFGLSDNDMQNIQFEQTKNGAQLTKESALWMISHFPDATEYIEAYNDSVLADLEEAEKSTLGAAKIIKDNFKYRQASGKATISRQAIIDYANAIKQPINEDFLKSFEADTEGNISVTMEEFEQIMGSAFGPELDALLSDFILESAKNEEKEISDAMKDIFSGLNSEDGFSSIDWNQYKEVLGPKWEEVKKDAETLSPIEFLNKYIDSFQGTISEVNDITLASVKKQEQNTRGLYDVFTSSVSWDPYYELFTASGDALKQIFANQGKELSQEWLDSLERDYKGNYKVSMQDLESQGIVFDKNLFEGYERWLQEQAKAREDQIHNDLSNVISTYIDQGFDAIDFRDYFDLPTETVQLIKESAELSKRDFVVRFAEAAGKTVSEMNQLYFEAWEKDIGLEATEAAKNMQYYFGGGMSGSSTDWQALLGDSVKVSELVRLGLLEYDAALNTYYSKNVEEIEQLTGIDIDDDAVTDSIRTAFEGIADQIMTGLDGALSNTEATKLKANLKYMGLGDVELDFSQGLEGLQLSQASAISLYTQLKKIDAIQANLMFKKLRESLEKSNDKYKTMTSLLENIYELQEKIDHAERYNPEKIKQFQEELALAKEIAAVRATSEDESFNFLDQDIPAAMNNPLNYTNNWIEAAKSMDEAWKNGKAYDFTRFYNIVHQINDVAKMTGMSLDFLGFTLDGSIDAVDAIIRHGIDKLGTDADMDFGVMFSDWGEGLEMGSQEFANGANNAIHAMALSQIKILDSLIAMFQAIVAMEEFEGADLDMNGILDFDEVFADFELGDEADTYTLQFQDAAQKILKMADANKEVQAALEQVKVNDVSMMEMLRDTTDGQRNVALTASEYQTAVSVFYEMLKSGDFDINNIAQSLRDNLAKNHSNFKGVIETQDMVIDMSYDIAINKTKDGKYKTPGGKEYDTAVEATKAGAVEAAGIDADKVQFDPITKNAYGTIEIADTEVTVTAYGKGKKTWKVDDQEYGSEESAIKAIYDKSSKELSFEAWKIDQEITAPIKVIQDVEVSSISKEQASHLVGKTFDQIKTEYDEAKGDHTLELEFQAKYGFKLDESSTSEDFEKFKEALGIESKNIEITASVKTAEGENSALMTALEGGSAEITISANTEEATQAVTTFTETVQGTPTTETITADSSQAQTIAGQLQDYINGLTASISIEASDHVTSAVDAIMASLPDSHTITVYTEDATSTSNDSSTAAKGNVSGGAMAKGTRTLMGELGPELYVTDGHYYVAGRNGAEFVDLPDDAIVFNHLQTAGLLGKGSAGRGRPITNERNAVSMATGSLGPAAASAKETLAALQQLRAMWQKLADSTIVDLAGVGGSNLSNIAGWVDEVERWYNLLQKIAQLEKDINYQEALRRKIETDRIRDGALYYKTLQDSYDNYIEQANAHRELYESQQQYFNQRREELNSEDAPFSKFYTYDENAQIKFKDGGYAALADLVKQYDTGELKYTPDEQYNIMQSYGLLQYGQYDSSGQEIKSSDFEDQREYRLAVVKAIWEKMDKEREEMQSLHDSIEENKTAYLEALTNGNELLQKVIDNQIQVENDVLAAIESREQAIIDELSEQREQLQKETDKYIKGLNDALSKERQLYEKNNEGSELTRLERQLAILRRSGGSASQIRSLESEIDSKRQDQYFSLQEEQINAVQEAADAQIQRLDTQIQLMEETLAFEKAHGMLWAEVEQIMGGSSNEIVSFLAMYSKDYAAQSAVQQQEWIREKQFEADLWTEYRSNAPDTIAEGIQKGSEPVAEERYDPEEFSMEKLETDEKNPAAGSSSSSGSSHSGGYSGGGGYSTPAKQEFDWKDYNRQSKRYDETEESKNIALGVMNQYKNNPYSLDYLDAHTAYQYYDKESKLAQSNMQRIKKGDKDYTPDYDESKTDAIILPSSDSGIRATSEAINTIKSNIETNNNTITQANAQIEAYKKAGLAEDSTEIQSIKSNIKKLEEANKAGEAQIKERQGWINAALGYKKGGIIDYTGLAIVHGSKEEPEAILNSKDYKLWKQSIGSNVWESIERERLEMQALHDTFNSVITNSSDSSIVIEKAEVNVNVEQIANDYDARRAGGEILQEMVRIARKTGTATIRR